MSSDEPPPKLKQTSVNQPQLQHSDSKQSITASEDYYSLSEPSSSDSDERSRLTATRNRAHPEQQPLEYGNARPSTILEVGESSASAGGRQSRNYPTRSSGVAFDESTIPERSPRRSNPYTEAARGKRAMDTRSPATTPGVDETPYLRFAIDQLTRDEEVRGSRHYMSHQEPRDEDDYPVERIISDEGLGYYTPPTVPVARSPFEPVSNELIYQAPQLEASEGTVVHRDIFVPHETSRQSTQHPPLTFLPAILRPFALALFAFFILLMLAGLLFCAIWSRSHAGLWAYNGFGGPRYFVFEYFPMLFGMIIIIWLFQVDIAMRRIAPFVALSKDLAKSRREGMFLDIYPTQFLLPNIQYFRARLTIFGICSIIFWLSLFTIPLLSAAFNVRYQGTATDGEWRWTVVQAVMWIAISLYILLALAILALVIFLFRKQTGLRWDPRSLADLITMLERSNIMKDYADTEVVATEKELRERVAGRADRLGYWKTDRRPTDIFYGLGEPGGATRRYSVEQGRIREKGPEKTFPQSPQAGDPSTHGRSISQPGDFSIRMDIRSREVRLRYLPWQLKNGTVIAWSIIAFVLVIAFLVVSFVNDAVRTGFEPRLAALANDGGFSASNFLYSFIPGLIGILLFLFWQVLDFTFRGLQPWATLSQGGATAEESLLVDYTARLPLSVSIVAAANKHYRVAILSLMTLVNIAIPILAGGVFWTQYYPGTNSVRVTAHLPGYYALCFFLALYAIAIFAILPGRQLFALPHRVANLAEVTSFLYQSPILSDRAFSRPNTKADLVTRLMGAEWAERSTLNRSFERIMSPSRSNLKEKTPPKAATTLGMFESEKSDKRQSLLHPGSILYGFGVHVGRDGQEHLGVDRIHRGPEREMVLYEPKSESWV